MLPRVDSSIHPVAATAALTPAEAIGDARQEAFRRSLSGEVGKTMQGVVIARLTDGSFLVNVAGTSARMLLPSNPQAGAELPLTLVSVTPRPTFQLGGAPQSAAIAAFVHDEPALYAADGAPGTGQARPADAMQRAARLFGAAPAAGELPAADGGGAQPTLSPAARAIGSVIGAALKSEHQQTAVVAPLPLLASASGDPLKLAAALKDAIGASGLFYESHVAEWSAGTRPLAELSREPQMQRAAAASASGAAQASAAEPATAQFINLQLSSQEQGRVAWQGELWPGQQMAWQINRDAPSPREQGGGEAPEAPWRSALRLRFPLLGEIAATVVLAGDQLHIQLQAGSEEVGSLLRARAGALHHALEASGAVPASLTISATGARDNG